jgi:hypothetical protein
MIAMDPTGHKAAGIAVDGVVPENLAVLGQTLDLLHQGGHGYKTLIIDGLSFLADMFVMETGIYWKEQYNAQDIDLLPIAGRQKILNQFKRMLRKAINLTQHHNPQDRMHVICTTLSERVKEAEDAPFTIRPNIGTQTMNEDMPSFFSVLSYIWPSGKLDSKTGMIDQTRYMQFAEANCVKAGDRLGIFPPAIIAAPSLSEYLTAEGAITK